MEIPTNTKNFGWIPDKVDERDFKYAAIREIQIDKVPKRVNLQDNMTNVEHQGWTSSCVANACVGALEFLYVMRILKKRWPCLKPRDYSRMFVYWYARKLDNIHNSDSGSVIRTAMKAMQQFGVCQEKYWEFEYKNLYRQPSKEARERSTRRKVLDYYKVESVNEIICALAEERPVIFGAAIYDSFMDPEPEQAKILMPDPFCIQVGRLFEPTAGHDDVASSVAVDVAGSDAMSVGFSGKPVPFPGDFVFS